MTVRCYLMPRVLIGTGPNGIRGTSRMPKYFAQITGRYTVLRYAQELACVVIADTDAAVHSALTANADVRAFPDDLDTVVTAGNRTAIVNALEAANVPAQWVANGQTFRVVLRRLAGMFDLLCNVHGRGLRFLQASLDAQISALPANVRQGMQDAASTLGLDTAGISGATTLRAALAQIAAQFDARPVKACRIEL